MKANRKFILDNKGAFTGQSVTVLVALLIAIVIAVLVYFEVSDINEFNERVERFTGFDGDQGSRDGIRTVNLTNSPRSAAQVNITFFNASGSGQQVCYTTSHTVNHRSVTTPANAASINFTQINVTYTSRAGTAEADDVTPMASTVFSLLPLIALVVVASVILVIIVGFGAGGRRGV